MRMNLTPIWKDINGMITNKFSNEFIIKHIARKYDLKESQAKLIFNNQVTHLKEKGIYTKLIAKNTMPPLHERKAGSHWDNVSNHAGMGGFTYISAQRV